MKKTWLAFLAFGALVNAAPVNVTLLNAGNGAVDSTGQYYVGPYTLTIDGIAKPAMCMDDFIDNDIGDRWTANQTSVGALEFGSTYLGNGGETLYGYHLSSAQIYKAEAYLFSLITKPGADQANLQEAAWVIMDPNNSTYSGISAVQNDVKAAFTAEPYFDVTRYTIVSDTVKGAKQEFMVASAPEPSTLALLGGGLLAAGMSRFRRKTKQAQLARTEM